MKIAFGFIFVVYTIFCLLSVFYLSHMPPHALVEYQVNRPAKHYQSLPTFIQIKDTALKKQRFFEYFFKIVDDENNRIRAQREILFRLARKIKQNDNLHPNDTKIIDFLSKVYKVPAQSEARIQLDLLLERVNTVPHSLVLAQAANESAWGTSRFARKGNNFFGQWCFKKGCGLVPRARNKQAHHEVRYFSNPAESVRSYLLNINTHPAYRQLRQIRMRDMQSKDNSSGVALAEGLTSYSERGVEYIKEIQTIIITNKLDSDDLPMRFGLK